MYLGHVKLRQHIGSAVTVTIAYFGNPKSYTTILRDVEPHRIMTTRGKTPFVGYGTAIQQITRDGEIVYRNHVIPDTYDCRDPSVIDCLRRNLGFESE